MLTRLTPDDFDAAYSILQDSFPPDEIRPYQQQKNLFRNPAYQMLGVRTSSGSLQALLAVYAFDTLLFVEHFAVAAPYRSQGMGGSMLREWMDGSDRMICLEVERPTTELAARRIGFYRRNGFFLNDYPYTQPPLTAQQKPVDLRLMSSGKPLDRAEFQAVRSLLLREVYHAPAADR